MIIEQIRYFADEAEIEEVLQARREVSRLRQQLNLPPGVILVADPPPDSGPELIWQCAYDDDATLGAAESALLGNPAYEAARSRLSAAVLRVEVEIYASDDEEEGPATP